MSRAASERWAIEEDLNDLADLQEGEAVSATTQEHGPIIYTTETPEDCWSVGFSGEGRCIERPVRYGLCAAHLPPDSAVHFTETPDNIELGEN